MLAENIVFGLISAAMVLAAVRLVTTANVVRAALYLTVVLAGAAAQFVILAADFVAVVQVLVYIGAIVVLFLFGIMLTRAPIGQAADLDNDLRWVAVVVSVFLLGVLSWVVLDAFPVTGADKVKVPLSKVVTHGGTTGPVGNLIFSSYVVPFEVVSVLLLAALVGAIVVARRD